MSLRVFLLVGVSRSGDTVRARATLWSYDPTGKSSRVWQTGRYSPSSLHLALWKIEHINNS